MRNILGFVSVLISLVINVKCDNFDVLIDAKATQQHRVDSLNLLIYCEFPDFSTFLALWSDSVARRWEAGGESEKKNQLKIDSTLNNFLSDPCRHTAGADSAHDMDIQISTGLMASRDWISCDLW